MGLNDIKPYKSHTHESGEFGVVDQIVHPAVRHVIELMNNNTGSTIEQIKVFGFARLLIPGQPAMRLSLVQVPNVLEFCVKVDIYHENVNTYELAPGAMKWINSWT